ncbi:MAG: relaxase domain-containing protein, partial [Firmicutes bacterium]|nr:relaxase domain-containing protein [Bacillota bacterium]
MAGRSALLTRTGTQTLISWISRTDSTERFERSVGDDLSVGYLPDATPESLAREGVPMRWTGTAAAALGLHGEASPRAAARVLTHGLGPHGEKLRTAIKAMPRRDPRTGEEIPQERRETLGWVLSAPKTVSLLLASNELDVRNAAIAALDRASEVAIRELEQQVTIRRGAQGVRSEGIQGLVGVKALHYTSSAGDPHLHVHYILNASAPAQSDGKWRALDSKVLFAAQRVAEAAFQATLKDELTRRLTLAEDAWTPRMVGSVPTHELAALLPAVDRFARAMAHMQDIAHKIAITLGGETRAQHDLIWALHRQDKKAVAEALEHAMDAAIATGGTAGEALRQEWRRWLGEHRAALDRLEKRPQIADTPNRSSQDQVTQIRSILDGSAQTVREQTQKADAQDQTVLQQVRGLAATLSQRLGPFTVADVTAYWVGWGFSLPEARQLTADTLRYWHREGLIHFPQGVDIATLLRTVERGMSTETRLQQQVWSHAGKIVSDDLLKREIAIAHTAQTLAQTHRRALAVDVTGLTPDQARAASLIAEGRALTTIQGVAGAGKSYLLKPIVQAAQRRPRQPMDVLVLARNAKLAGELGSELGVKSSTLAQFRHRQQPITRPTLLIVDEAGLVDQTDWQAILDTAQQNPHVQLVAVGDRLQAQPIDRLATWAVISQAAQNVGAYAELSQSFRNRAWIDEATALRAGSPTAAQMAATSQRLFTAPDGHSAAWTAQLVLKLRERGEDALAIAATNEEAADIATHIQHLRGIQPDPRTTLRWGQQTGVGDTVRTRKNDRAAKIHNGDVWTVTAIDDRRLTL